MCCLDKIVYVLTRRAVNTAVNKIISDELDINVHVIASQLFRYCDVISNQLWRHQQNEYQASKGCSFLPSAATVRNSITYIILYIQHDFD